MSPKTWFQKLLSRRDASEDTLTEESKDHVKLHRSRSSTWKKFDFGANLKSTFSLRRKRSSVSETFTESRNCGSQIETLKNEDARNAQGNSSVDLGVLTLSRAESPLDSGKYLTTSDDNIKPNLDYRTNISSSISIHSLEFYPNQYFPSSPPRSVYPSRHSPSPSRFSFDESTNDQEEGVLRKKSLSKFLGTSNLEIFVATCPSPQISEISSNVASNGEQYDYFRRPSSLYSAASSQATTYLKKGLKVTIEGEENPDISVWDVYDHPSLNMIRDHETIQKPRERAASLRTVSSNHYYTDRTPRLHSYSSLRLSSSDVRAIRFQNQSDFLHRRDNVALRRSFTTVNSHLNNVHNCSDSIMEEDGFIGKRISRTAESDISNTLTAISEQNSPTSPKLQEITNAFNRISVISLQPDSGTTFDIIKSDDKISVELVRRHSVITKASQSIADLMKSIGRSGSLIRTFSKRRQKNVSEVIMPTEISKDVEVYVLPPLRFASKADKGNQCDD
ncbi:hypothetical protein HK098_007097 [Nowakowskiella sp. JEL0407]|nr:hypothetical protein HK098_007097 [Nowakowskiella sp. JEL0407]